MLIKILFEFTHIYIRCILGLQVHGPMTGGLISGGGGGGLKSSSLKYGPKDFFCLRVRVSRQVVFPNIKGDHDFPDVVMASLLNPL